MRIFTRLLERILIEDLTGSPNWESTWWNDVVFRGLQESESGQLVAESETADSPDSKNFELL